MVHAAGLAPGERRLLGPQTTGRTYRNLSRPQYRIRHRYNVSIPMRDGVHLLADLYQPRVAHPVPVRVAIAPYARQAQYLRLPAGMIEAGQTDFWVPRGYAHLIVNVRGTCGSEGVYGFGSVAEHQDLYDVIEHQFDDAYWQARNITHQLSEIDIPLYLGADWDNVAVHLNTPFVALDHLKPTTPWRIGLTPRGGLQWPWESLHVEALTWYDHWLKGRDTGIMEGPPIRFFLGDSEAQGEWREAMSWPLPETRWHKLWLAAAGTLLPSTPAEAGRDYLVLPPTMQRGRNANPPSLPTTLQWETPPLGNVIDLAGPFVLHLEATSTATDTDWIVKLTDVAPDGQVCDLTQGWLRASHRAVDGHRSTPYRPYHLHDRAELLTPGQQTPFTIEVLSTAHRLLPSHRLRLALTSDDRGAFAMQRLCHDPLGLPARNTVSSASWLTVPVVAGLLPE